MTKRTPIIVLIICLAVPSVLLLVVNKYLESSYFAKLLEDRFSDLSGRNIDIHGNVDVESLFPVLKVNISSAVLRANDNEDLRSMRVTDFDLAVSSKAALFKTGNLHFDTSASSVALIMDRSSDAAQHEASKTQSVYEAITNYQQQLYEATVTLKIAKLHVFLRNEGVSASQNLFLNTSVTAGHQHLLISSQYVGENDDVSQFHLSLPATSVRTNGNSLEGMVKASIKTSNAASDYQIAGEYIVENNDININQLNLRGPDLDVRGNLKLSLAEVTSLTGDMQARRVELRHFSTVGAADQTSGGKVFSETPLRINSNLYVDVKIELGAIRYNNQPVVSGVFQIVNTPEKLSIKSDELFILGGNGSLSLLVEESERAPKISIKAAAAEAQLSRLQIHTNGKALFTEGTASALVSIKANGNSTAALARDASGYFMSSVSQVEINRKYAEALDKGVVTWVKQKIQGISKKNIKYESSPAQHSDIFSISCGSLRLVINKGQLKVSNGAVIELPENTLVSSGFIDFHTEKIGFVFRTKKRSLFNWSAISLLKFVELGGLLGEPKMTLDKKSLAKQGLLSATSMLVGSLPPLVYSLAESGLKNREKIECVPLPSNGH